VLGKYGMALARDSYGQIVQALTLTNGSGQNVTITASSAQSTALPAGTAIIRLVASVDCYVEIGGASPVAAVGTSAFLPAGSPEYFSLDTALVNKVAVIGTSGVLNIVVAS
jgi:hypothetical protein